MRNSEYNPWVALAIGIVLIFSGSFKLVTGIGGDWHDVYIPAWTGWIFVPLGLIIAILSLRSLRTWKEPEPPKYTDEEVVKARENLDRMYLREHGGPPEAPVTEEIMPKSVPGSVAPASKNSPKVRQGLLLMLAGVGLYIIADSLTTLILSPVLFMVGLCRAVIGGMETK